MLGNIPSLLYEVLGIRKFYVMIVLLFGSKETVIVTLVIPLEILVYNER